MNPQWRLRLYVIGPVLVVILALAAGCGARATEEPVAGAAYSGVLSTAYADALDPINQLALGTLKLEETADAVTEAQVAQLLPLWEVLAGSGVQVESERLAIAKQIERAMTEAQVAAIAAMQLTQADEQAWTQDQGFGGAGGGPAAPAGADAPDADAVPAMSEQDRAAMREKFQNLTDEERAQMAQQFGQQGGAGGRFRQGVAGSASSGVLRAVVMLLTERSGQALALPNPERPLPPAVGDVGAPLVGALPDDAAVGDVGAPLVGALPDDAVADDVGAPLVGALPVGALPVGALPAGALPATPSPTTTPQAAATVSTTVTWISASTTAAAQPITTQETAADAQSIVSLALAHIQDTDPGPPFSVEISLNQATPNPLLDGTRIYRISGLLRNEGDEVYAVNTVHVTFFDASGFRGSFNAFPRRRYGEYIWHGAMEADFDCMLLAPGEACPFTAEISAYDMGSFLVHADAVVAEWREPAPVQVQSPKLVDQGSTVQISGTIVNPNDYAIKNVVVNASLLDANGQITSMGSAYIVQSIAPGASVSFVAMVPAEPYATYTLHAQAEGDFR